MAHFFSSCPMPVTCCLLLNQSCRSQCKSFNRGQSGIDERYSMCLSSGISFCEGVDCVTNRSRIVVTAKKKWTCIPAGQLSSLIHMDMDGPKMFDHKPFLLFGLPIQSRDGVRWHYGFWISKVEAWLHLEWFHRLPWTPLVSHRTKLTNNTSVISPKAWNSRQLAKTCEREIVWRKHDLHLPRRKWSHRQFNDKDKNEQGNSIDSRDNSWVSLV